MARKGNARKPSEAQREAERRERFVRLIPKRVNAARHALKLVGNCASTYSYAYEPEEARRVVESLRDAMEAVEARFLNVGPGDDAFKL